MAKEYEILSEIFWNSVNFIQQKCNAKIVSCSLPIEFAEKWPTSLSNNNQPTPCLVGYPMEILIKTAKIWKFFVEPKRECINEIVTETNWIRFWLISMDFIDASSASLCFYPEMFCLWLACRFCSISWLFSNILAASYLK